MSFKEYFNDKHVLITGASKGIGKALALRLNEYKAIVYAVSRNADGLKLLSNDAPNIRTICIDIEDWKLTKEVLGGIDIAWDLLINNAAIGIPQSFLDIDPDIFDRMMSANVKAMINISQVFAKKLIAVGKPGSIVNVSSALTTVTVPNLGLYAATKSAVNSLSRTMANEFGKYRIRVNAITPSMVQTEMVQPRGQGFGQSVAGACPGIGPSSSLAMPTQDPADTVDMGRYPLGQCFIPIEQVVNSTLFLLSDMASLIHGESLVLDGGRRVT